MARRRDTATVPPIDDDARPLLQRLPALARTGLPHARVPLQAVGRVVGSVATDHLDALHTLARAEPALQVAAAGVRWRAGAAALPAGLQRLNGALRDQGLIRAWRGEAFMLRDPITRAPVAPMERAAFRFWGALTEGAHANGYRADATGRPTHLWVAQRAWNKPTDPGRHDNLVAGGVGAGQTPHQTLLREAWEEAGIPAPLLHALRPGRVIRLCAAVPEGLQWEDLHAFDLPLPRDFVPRNTDGEVAGFALLPVDEALHRAATLSMTLDAALVTLDFALRHALLPPAQAEALGPAFAALCVPARPADPPTPPPGAAPLPDPENP
jgi:8-oxo-dGTP pyrophosphatase MutT (NUDIX family)